MHDIYIYNYGVNLPAVSITADLEWEVLGDWDCDGCAFSRGQRSLFSLSSGIYVHSAPFSVVCPGRRWYECLVYGCARIHHSFSASSASPRFCICYPLLERDASLIKAENSIIYGQKHIYLGVGLALFQFR